MSRTGHQPGLSGAVQKGMHDSGPPLLIPPRGEGGAHLTGRNQKV